MATERQENVEILKNQLLRSYVRDNVEILQKCSWHQHLQNTDFYCCCLSILVAVKT